MHVIPAHAQTTSVDEGQIQTENTVVHFREDQYLRTDDGLFGCKVYLDDQIRLNI